MTQYDNTNRGTLFKNDRKTADTHADYTGSINVNGQEFWLNGWLKDSKLGGKFFSLSVRPKEARGAPANDLRVSDSHGDAIPF